MPTSQQSYLARLDTLFSQLPDHVYDWLFSSQTGQSVKTMAKRFGLTEQQTSQLSRVIGLAVLKDFPLPQIIPEIRESLNINDSLAKEIALAVAQTQFLSLRDHLIDVENFIRQTGGSLPVALPPTLKSSFVPGSMASNAPASQTPQVNIIQKTLRHLAKDNKDALNQNLTTAPIKIADFDQPVRPTIKNWLVDYVKQKGAGHHEAMERGDYLFNSVNSRPLPEKEKSLLAEILRAYDDDTPLPINEADQMILLDKLTLSAASAPALPKPEPAARPMPVPPKIPVPPPPPAPNTNYREPISETDITGPLTKPAPPRPAPRLSGNIIDLKDLQ